MKITRLEIDNFMGIGSAKVRLDDRGLVLIQGENNDDSSANSNGSGKSTLAEALSWCIYGKTARGLAGDDVVNTKAKKDCEVSTQISDGEEEYIIHRWRKKTINGKRSGVSLMKVSGGAEIDMTSGTDKLTQETINRVMGCSESVFTAAIYAGQEKMPDIPNMTDRELKSLIEEAAGIDLIEQAYEIARGQLAEAKRNTEEIQRQLQALEDRVNMREEAVAHANRDRASWDATRNTRIEGIKERIQEVAKNAKAYAHNRDQYDADKLEAAVKALDEEEAAIRASLTGIEEERSTERSLVAKLQDVSREYMAAKSFQSRVKDEIDAALRDKKNAAARVGSACRECGKPITEGDVQALIDAAKNKAGALHVREVEADDDVLRLEKLAGDAQSKLDSFRDGMTDTSKQVERIGAISRERSTLADALRSRERYADKLEDAKRAVRDLTADLTAMKSETNPHSETIDRAQKALDAEKVRVKEAMETWQKSGEAELLAKQVVEVFGPKGVRAHILDTVTPFLNARTATYLAALSDGNIEAEWTTLTQSAKGELREQFAVTVSKPGMGSKFTAVSGGEKRKVRLSCALALQDLVASRASKPIELWIGDEIDDALDDAGLERLMGVLEEKARERGTVLVISHNSLRDWIRDHATVTMKDRQATISGVLNV